MFVLVVVLIGLEAPLAPADAVAAGGGGGGGGADFWVSFGEHSLR